MKRKRTVAFTDEDNVSVMEGDNQSVTTNDLKRKRRSNKWIPVNSNNPNFCAYSSFIGKCFTDSDILTDITYKIVNIFQNEMYGETLFFGYI